MIPVPRDIDSANLVMMTRQGLIKRTPYSEFANLRKSGLIAITLKEDDELCAVNLTDGDTSLIIASRAGRALRIHESTIRVIGRTGMGVHAMKLKDGDELIDMSPIREGQKVLATSRASPTTY